jgi:hypothetical protein
MSKTKQKKPKQKEMTPKQAKKLLEKQSAMKIAAVEAGIQTLLQKHNCAMDIQMTFSANRGVLGGRVVIVPLPDPPTE